jgi:ADP-ribose pyrophosphatase YjhB (NUDIX family)
MLNRLITKIWSAIPPSLRLRLVRGTQKKFTASVAAIITNPNGKVLLLNHILRPHSTWGLPGGFIEAGEQPETAIRREIREETGLELDDLKMLRVRTIDRHIEMLFRARSSGVAEIKSREISDLGWYSPAEMPQGTSNLQKYLIEEVLASEV